MSKAPTKYLAVLLAASAVTLLFLVMAGAFTAKLPPGTIQIGGSRYHFADIQLDSCTLPPGNHTPVYNAIVDGVSFNVQIIGCYSSGGSSLSGNVSEPGVGPVNFVLSTRQPRDSGGMLTWASGDGRFLVEWNASDHARVFVRADE